MFEVLLMVAAIWIPLDPKSDQAKLSALVVKNRKAVAEWSARRMEGRIWKWSGEQCLSRVEFVQGWDNLFNFTIDWSTITVAAPGDGSSVRLEGAVVDLRRSTSATLTIRYASHRKTEAARQAMTRLQAACRPQR